MPSNWERNQKIKAAVPGVIAQVNPQWPTWKRKDQVAEIIRLRRLLQTETGCGFDTTARHIGDRGILEYLRHKGQKIR